MTHPHPGAARDVDLAAWLNAAGFHPADTTLKQLGHQAARTVIGELGTILWQILPPSHEKSLVFTALEQARWAANQALAVHGGPGEHVTEDNLRELLASLAVDMPADPRIREYEAQQRGEELGRAVVADVPEKATGYVSPFQAPGHDGEHHALRLTHDRDEHTNQAARVAEAIRTTLRGDYEIRAEDYRAAAYAAMGANHGTTGSWWTLADATPQDEAVGLLDGLNDEVNRRWPGAGWTIGDDGEQSGPAVTPPADLDPDVGAPRGYYLDDRGSRVPVPLDDAALGARHSGVGNSAGAVIRNINGPGYVWLSTAPVVIPPAEEHHIPDSAVEDRAAYVLWGLEDTATDTDGVALGVGLEPGRVTLHLSNGSTRLAAPFFSQSTLNRAIEAMAASGGRAFQ